MSMDYEEGNDEVGRTDPHLDTDGHRHGIRCHELHGKPLTRDARKILRKKKLELFGNLPNFSYFCKSEYHTVIPARPYAY